MFFKRGAPWVGGSANRANISDKQKTVSGRLGEDRGRLEKSVLLSGSRKNARRHDKSYVCTNHEAVPLRCEQQGPTAVLGLYDIYRDAAETGSLVSPRWRTHSFPVSLCVKFDLNRTSAGKMHRPCPYATSFRV